MDPSCSHSKYDIHEGTKAVPFENNGKSNKTDREASTLENNNENNKENNNIKDVQIDDIEREDFEEENRILNHCSSVIVNADKLTATAHFSGNLSSANSSLTSSSEALSAANHIQPDFSLPGCSKSEVFEDSNTTIKNMIRSKRPVYSNKADSSRKNDVCYENNFMKTLVCNSYKSSTLKLKSIELLKNFNSNSSESCDKESPEQCDVDRLVSVEGTSSRADSNASSIVSNNSESIQENNLPSTSSGSKLLGMDETQSKSEIGISDKIKLSSLVSILSLVCLYQTIYFFFTLSNYL